MRAAGADDRSVRNVGAQRCRYGLAGNQHQLAPLEQPARVACSMNASRSPPHRLEWMTSESRRISAEISAPYWPAPNLGICEVVTLTLGFQHFIAASKSVQESWPQA